MTDRTPAPDPRGGLALLVETEDRLEAILAARRQEAARLVEAARTRAAEASEGWAQSLPERAAALDREIEEGAAAACREAEARSERGVARWRLSDERLEELARHVVDRLLESPGEAP